MSVKLSTQTSTRVSRYYTLWYCLDSLKTQNGFLINIVWFVAVVHFCVMFKSLTTRSLFCNLSSAIWVFRSNITTSAETGRSKHILQVQKQAYETISPCLQFCNISQSTVIHMVSPDSLPIHTLSGNQEAMCHYLSWLFFIFLFTSSK